MTGTPNIAQTVYAVSGEKMRKGQNKMRGIRGIVWGLVVLAVGTPALWAQQEVEFNYNGRVHVAGSPFSGTGYFKFSLVAGSPETTIWANDGAAIDGFEPSSSIATTVTQGFFSVDIGDTSTPNMAALNPTLFNRDDKVYLRSWFSDGTHGFEQMHPDRRVVNPALLGSVSLEAIDLYVNPATGSDIYAGTQNKPMKTLQAAWNSLPASLSTTATIHLAPGSYYESPTMTGKSMSGAGRILIFGDPADPSQVLLKGTDETETTKTRSGVAVFESQRSVTIRGITALGETYAPEVPSILINVGSEVEIVDSVMDHAQILVLRQSYATIKRVESFFAERPYNQNSPTSIYATGISSGLGSFCEVSDSLIHDAEYGFWVGSTSVGRLINVTIDDCYFGVVASDASTVYFEYPGSTVSTCHNGVLGKMNATLQVTNNITFIGNEDNDLLLWTGAQQSP